MNFTYKTLLSLDSIAKHLTQHERCTAIKLMLNHEAEPTPKMQEALKLIEKHQWEPPEFKVGHDRITRFYNTQTERWEVFEFYEHEIVHEVEKLKS